MPVAKVIRYTTKPEWAQENERLIRDVFAELAADQPDGLRYAAFRLDDGLTFMHVAVLDDQENPLMPSADGDRQAGQGRCHCGSRLSRNARIPSRASGN